MLSIEEGREAVRLPRRVLEDALGRRSNADPVEEPGPGTLPSVFDQHRGAFVTLKRHPSGELRGCIGYPLPVLPLRSALARAAVAAAVEDPRFPPVDVLELPFLAIEVSVLTVPVPVRSARTGELLAAIRVGRDGLIVDGFGASGLLLPQVAREQGWSAEDFLDGTCEKAGLPAGAWRDPRVTVRRFEAEVFRERSPGGEVVRDESDLTPDGGRLAP